MDSQTPKKTLEFDSCRYYIKLRPSALRLGLHGLKRVATQRILSPQAPLTPKTAADVRGSLPDERGTFSAPDSIDSKDSVNPPRSARGEMRRALARVAEPQRGEPVGGWRSQPPREDEAVS